MRSSDVRESLTAPSFGMVCYNRKTSGGGNSIMNNMQVMKDRIVRNPVREIFMISHDVLRALAANPPSRQGLLVVVNGSLSVRRRLSNKFVDFTLRFA